MELHNVSKHKQDAGRANQSSTIENSNNQQSYIIGKIESHLENPEGEKDETFEPLDHFVSVNFITNFEQVG